MFEESNQRRSKSSDGNSAVAEPILVATTSAVNRKDSSSRRKYRDIIAGLTDEEKKLETPTRENDYVSNFLQSISGEDYRKAMSFILEIVKQSELDMKVILNYIKSFGATALRRKLRGWLAFYKYCQEKEISIQQVIDQDPVKIATQFMWFLRQQKEVVSDYVVADAKYALSTLFEDILGKHGIRKSKIVSAMVIPKKLHVPRNKRYTKIWGYWFTF
jgi:hypothetical protein